jgi:LAT3 family solute carrier family 43 protein 3
MCVCMFEPDTKKKEKILNRFYTYLTMTTGETQPLVARTKDTIPSQLRITTNALALLSVFLFSGVIFGWAPLELLLLREGQYSETCENGEAMPCPTQIARLQLVFTAGQFILSFASLPVGYFLDHAPKSLFYFVTAVVEVTGLCIFASSDSESFDYFVLGYSLMALGGCMTMLGAFPASFLIPKHQAGILAAISCLFDASSIVFFVFHRVELKAPNVSRQSLFLILACIGVAVYTPLAVFWSILEKKNWKEVLDQDKSHVESHTLQKRSLCSQLATPEFLLVTTFASIHMLRCNFYVRSTNLSLSLSLRLPSCDAHIRSSFRS